MIDLVPQHHDSMWEIIEHWVRRSDSIFIKKLSRNDRSWAEESGKHQAGFYVPREIREAGFFPPLVADNPAKPHILHVECPTFWPQTGELKPSNMRHYTNKGTEAHFTKIPKDAFAHLNPASLLICGRLITAVGDAHHWMLTLDSASDDAEVLETVLDLPADFHYLLIEPRSLLTRESFGVDQVAELIDQLQKAIKAGTLDAFIHEVTKLPAPEKLALAAQEAWLEETGHVSLDPYKLKAPGDALMRISRDIEFRIFRGHELRRRAAEVARVLTTTSDDLVTAVVRGFSDLNAIFLSASQQRKTRAGRSFEQHISRMLRDGGIRFAEQAVLGGKRPDFVLPDLKTLSRKDRDYAGAIVLSAKTTLRERWKQVRHERFNCDVFLATVDDRVPVHVIEALADQGIRLVVPESLKSSKESCYPQSSNVISFHSFLSSDVSEKRPFLLHNV